MKRFLVILGTYAAFFMAACLPQATPTSSPGSIEGIPLSATGEGESTLKDETPPDIEAVGKTSPPPVPNAPADSSGSSAMPLYAKPMPIGDRAPPPYPEGDGHFILRGSSEVLCSYESSNRSDPKRMQIQGALRYVRTHFVEGPDGKPLLVDGEEQNLSASSEAVLRTVYVSGNKILFWDEIPSSTTPEGFAIKGVSLGLVDFDLVTTDPDSISFYLTNIKNSPLNANKADASGSCIRFSCLAGASKLYRVGNKLTVTPPEDPLPKCRLSVPMDIPIPETKDE